MSGIWLISYVGLWILMLALLLSVVTLARLVGLLHVRIGPTGARVGPAGPGIGAVVPPRELSDVFSVPRPLGGAAGHPTLLAFVSPSCSACEQVAAALATLARSERNLTIFALSSRGDEATNRAIAERWWGGHLPLILLPPDAVIEFQVHTTPYAIVLDAAGVVRAKGVVNQVEHLHSLLNALDSGYATTGQLTEAKRHNRMTPLPVVPAASSQPEVPR